MYDVDPKLKETRQALLIKSMEFDASQIGLNMYEQAIKSLLIEKVVKTTAAVLTSKAPHYLIIQFLHTALYRYGGKFPTQLFQQQKMRTEWQYGCTLFTDLL